MRNLGARALRLAGAGEGLAQLSTVPAPEDNLEFIRRSGAGVLFENTPVNYHSGQPAIDHLRTALENGMHAITANKGPVVCGYHALTELAAAQCRHFMFESAVMDGAPIFSLFRSTLPGASLLGFRGILNSCTNLILTRMENGESFEEAVRIVPPPRSHCVIPTLSRRKLLHLHCAHAGVRRQALLS